MRVLSGKAKGRRLFSVKGFNTRPTSEKVKGSIFDILSCDFEGQEVLDLFAGTGSLGIEALSRGALKAVFIESNRQALSALEKNLRNSGFFDQSWIMKTTVERGIRVLEKRANRFDLIFMDPPYDRGFLNSTLAMVSRSNILKDSALVIVEHSSSDSLECSIKRLALNDQRRYGNTLVSFFEQRNDKGET